MQADGRLEQQGLTGTGLGGSCREDAAARRPRHGCLNNRAMQANGRRGILSILGVWRLANGRLERPNNRGYVQATAICTGLGGSCREEKAARRPWHGRRNNRGLCRQTAGGRGMPQGWVEAAARKLPRGALGMDAVKNRGLCRQTAGGAF